MIMLALHLPMPLLAALHQMYFKFQMEDKKHTKANHKTIQFQYSYEYVG